MEKLLFFPKQRLLLRNPCWCCAVMGSSIPAAPPHVAQGRLARCPLLPPQPCNLTAPICLCSSDFSPARGDGNQHLEEEEEARRRKKAQPSSKHLVFAHHPTSEQHSPAPAHRQHHVPKREQWREAGMLLAPRPCSSLLQSPILTC